MKDQIVVRPAHADDVPALTDLIGNTEYVHVDFAVHQLPKLVTKETFVVATIANQLAGFLYLRLWHHAFAVWEGIGIRQDFAPPVLLDLLLPPALAKLREYGATRLFYVGDAEWLMPLLHARGFTQPHKISLYEKTDFTTPTAGNSQVRIRPATVADIPHIIALDEAAFDDLWRFDTQTFAQQLNEAFSFSVALLDGNIVGYQCSLLLDVSVHLSRLVVHPTYQGRQIGARLLSEVIQQLKNENVQRITVNTQRDNLKSRRLYRWFGFQKTGETPVFQLEFGAGARDDSS